MHGGLSPTVVALAAKAGWMPGWLCPWALPALYALSPCHRGRPWAAPVPTRGPGSFSSVRATGWAGSSLNLHQPQEMFACSGIYSRRLWIKERMGIIFPGGRRAYFRHRSVAGQPSLGPSEPVGELTQDWGVSDRGAVLRRPRTRSLGRDLPTNSGIPQRVGGQPSFTTCSFSLCPSALPPPGPSGPRCSPL